MAPGTRLGHPILRVHAEDPHREVALDAPVHEHDEVALACPLADAHEAADLFIHESIHLWASIQTGEEVDHDNLIQRVILNVVWPSTAQQRERLATPTHVQQIHGRRAEGAYLLVIQAPPTPMNDVAEILK